MSAVALFCPNPFSLYTICVTELLERDHVEVKAIYVRRLLNPNRFFSEFNRDGSRLIKKIWKKLVLRKRSYSAANYETLASFMIKENIRVKKVDEFTEKYGIPIVYCDDLNDSVVVENLKLIKPDLVVFTGGGLIRKEVLANSGSGILNCHMGMLPQYRGMDVVEWPILEGNLEKIGLTVHFMDEGVDTGDILKTSKVDFEPGEAIQQIRERFEPIMCRELVSTCQDYLNGKVMRTSQKKEDGRQYFKMHPRLIELADKKLSCQCVERREV